MHVMVHPIQTHSVSSQNILSAFQKAYDLLESRTTEQIQKIRQQLEEEKDSRLAQLRADTDATFSSLDARYEQQHVQLSRELFEKILAM